MPKALNVLCVALLMATCVSCSSRANEVLETEGLRFEYVSATGTLDVKVANDVSIVIPTTDIAFQTDGSRFWGVNGVEYGGKASTKQAIEDFSTTVAVRPGVVISIPVKRVTNTTLVIDIPDSYSLELENYYKRKMINLWHGKGELH